MNNNKNICDRRYILAGMVIVLSLVSCGGAPVDTNVDINSEGGVSEFFSGEKPKTQKGTISSPNTPPVFYESGCPGALDSRLNLGDTAQIIIYQLSARSAPGFDAPKEHVLAEGRTVEIVNGPKCADSAWWWQIHFSGTISTGEYLDYYAWIVEVDYDTYYLQKVN